MRLTRAQLLLPLGICLFCQALYRAVSVDALAYTAREAFFGGLCAAVVGAVFLSAFLCFGDALSALPTACTCKNVACVLVGASLIIGAGQTVIWQLRFYQQMFGAGGGWVLLFCVVAVCVHCTPHALVRCARLLGVFCVAMAICALLGLLGQSDLQRLATEPLTATGFSAAFWAQLCLLPDYLLLLAFPVCRTAVSPSGNREQENESDGKENESDGKENYAKTKENVKRFLLLPLVPFGVQFTAVLFTELLFGVQQTGVGGFEFLRSWALLNLSRYDGIVALLWLLLAFFRLRVFVFVAWQCCPLACVAKEVTTDEGEVE